MCVMCYIYKRLIWETHVILKCSVWFNMCNMSRRFFLFMMAAQVLFILLILLGLLCWKLILFQGNRATTFTKIKTVSNSELKCTKKELLCIRKHNKTKHMHIKKEYDEIPRWTPHHFFLRGI